LCITTSTHIKSTGVRECRSRTGRHASEQTKLKDLVSALKTRVKDQKRIIREKDKMFADLNWKNIQLKNANTRLEKKMRSTKRRLSD
jgi:hypothetical protein